MNVVCYLCGSDQHQTVFIENGIPIVQCTQCKHVFSTYEQEEHYAGYWEDTDYDLNWWDHAHREVYQQFIETFLPKTGEGSLLDVGCGLGFFVKTVMEKRPEWNVLGYEMSANAVKFAKERNGLTNVYEGVVQSGNIKENSIDIVTLWDVIEHIPKPDPLLQYIHTILKPGGFLFLQTPNFPIQLIKARLKVLLKGMRPDVHYLEAKDHINNYSRKTMSILAKKNNFQEPEFYVMKPIVSVSGSKNSLGKFAKVGYYAITKLLWKVSFHTCNWNNTLFAILRK
jgi:2-polyprenyl-3-methyl-5-hydroxy-6-metoxy-1,4-benzoquinol methylase